MEAGVASARIADYPSVPKTTTEMSSLASVKMPHFLTAPERGCSAAGGVSKLAYGWRERVQGCTYKPLPGPSSRKISGKRKDDRMPPGHPLHAVTCSPRCWWAVGTDPPLREPGREGGRGAAPAQGRRGKTHEKTDHACQIHFLKICIKR